MSAALALASLFSRGAQAADVDTAAPSPPSAPAIPVAAPPRNALSLQLLSLVNSGVNMQYERLMAPRFSFGPSIGFRKSGGVDIDVLESSFGIESRYWLIGRESFSRFAGRAIVGPYLSARVDFGITRDTQSGHVLGTQMSVAEGMAIGMRFVFARRIELTPSAGLGLRTDFDPRGRLAPLWRGELGRFALYTGILF